MVLLSRGEGVREVKGRSNELCLAIIPWSEDYKFLSFPLWQRKQYLEVQSQIAFPGFSVPQHGLSWQPGIENLTRNRHDTLARVDMFKFRLIRHCIDIVQ